MPTPKNVKQVEAIRALIRAGSAERRSKGGHRAVKMPNGNTVPIPTGTIKPGTLEAIVKGAGLSMEEFVRLL
ncbi:MAG: addiction module toxin, HicA family [Dehalococcoidia bacterium]|nr:addiction module toxin, HicA family [Dehalococcoidia bacterium]